MNMILATIIQEKRRIEYMIEKYSESLHSLPKGSLSARRVGTKTYFYLKYREGEKVISKYIPADQAEELREKIEKRRHAEKMLASLQKEKLLADKIIGGSI